MPKLVHGKIRWRTSSKIDKIRLAPADEGLSCVNRQLAQDSLKITTNCGGIFVRINLEITEMTAFAAKWNVNIDAERIAGSGRAFNRLENLIGKFGLPKRIRR